MKVLLVRPPVPAQTMGLKHVMLCEPLELEYVAAGLAGHDVEILDLLVRGLPTSQVAARLFLAPKTVRNRVSDMLTKL